jgi:hypothetical protein
MTPDLTKLRRLKRALLLAFGARQDIDPFVCLGESRAEKYCVEREKVLVANIPGGLADRIVARCACTWGSSS